MFIPLFVIVGFVGALMSSLSVCDRDRLPESALLVCVFFSYVSYVYCLGFFCIEVVGLLWSVQLILLRLSLKEGIKDVSSRVFPRAGSSSSLSRRARRVSSVTALSGELASVFFYFIACLSRFLAKL